MPKQSTHTHAQTLHIEAEALGHDIVWQHNIPDKAPNGSSLATGYIGRCNNPKCRLRIDVSDNDTDELIRESNDPMPKCPLNSNLNPQ